MRRRVNSRPGPLPAYIQHRPGFLLEGSDFGGSVAAQDYRKKDWTSAATSDDARVLARDPAPPATSLLRGFGGDGTRCRLPTKKGSQMQARKMAASGIPRP